MRAFVLGALLALAATGAAQAQEQRAPNRFSKIDGAKLVGLCSNKDPKVVVMCDAYIDGVADAAAFYQRLRPADGSKGEKLPGYICVPGPTTGVQMRQAVIEWFKKHPDQGNRQASGVVLQALDQAYLCPGEQRRVPSE